MKPAPDVVTAEELDLGHLAYFVGLSANAWVLEAMTRGGFAALRPSHGFLVQHLLGGPRTASELARLLGVTQQAVSKSVAELRDGGYLEVAPSDDARERRVQLSARGRASVKEARALRKRLEAKLRKAVGPKAYDAAKKALALALDELGGAEAVRQRRVRLPT